VQWRRYTLTLTIVVAVASSSFAAEPAVIYRGAALSGERTWRKVRGSDSNATPNEKLSAREIFSYALALAEANVHPERLEKLFTVASQMQDRDKAGRGYGNFRWYWRDEAVKDFNSVEFCMQGGSVLWIRHRDRMPPAARKVLQPMLELAIEGCLRHAVRTSYTNIALMNAENLILLGEALDRPKVADEGYRRLKEILLYTWECGIGEYVSPTYCGVDLECLLLIHRFARRPEGRAWAAALLELIWTDIAANWYAPAARLGGARSRDYNFLRGTGYLDRPLRAFGFLENTGRYDINWPFLALAAYRPPQRLHKMATTQFPRLVRQRWGDLAAQFRTHYVCKDVTLSCAGANYGAMDLPLTVDFPGPRDSLRCYYIPDGRHDPYGKKRIPAGAHSKTLHLKSFWAGTQRRSDALGIVLHDPPAGAPASDSPTGTPVPPTTLETHFVMPLDVDAFWVGDKRITFDPKDVGRDILRLKNLTPIKARAQAIAAVKPITVPADKGVYFEAESAAVIPGMTVAADPAASGGRYIWAPGQPGGRGRVSGSATWRLKVPKSARYLLWARRKQDENRDRYRINACVAVRVWL